MLSLYRRHRPRTFDSVVGQEHIVKTLRNAIELGQVHDVLAGARQPLAQLARGHVDHPVELVPQLVVDIGHHADAKMLHHLRERIVDHLGAVPLGWFRNAGSGQVKKAMTVDLEAMHVLFAHALGEVVGAGLIAHVPTIVLPEEERRRQMAEHIKVGRRYPMIQQLLAYSYGLDDQEFIVAYETDDLVAFQDLVRELRESESRRATVRDTPIITGIHRPLGAILGLLSGPGR